MIVPPLHGLLVNVIPDQPKMRLSEDVPVSDACREETNAWMLEFFGTTNLIPDGAFYNLPGAVLMNPRTYAALKQRTSAR